MKLFYLNYTLRSETPFSRKIEGDPANSIAEQMIRLNKPTKHARTLHRQIRSPNYLPQTLTTFVPPKLSVALSCYFPELFSTLPARKSFLPCSYAKILPGNKTVFAFVDGR